MITLAAVTLPFNSSNRVAFGPFPSGSRLSGLTLTTRTGAATGVYLGVGATSSIPDDEIAFEAMVRRPYTTGVTTPGWLALLVTPAVVAFLPMDLQLEAGESHFVVQVESDNAAGSSGSVALVISLPDPPRAAAPPKPARSGGKLRPGATER